MDDSAKKCIQTPWNRFPIPEYSVTNPAYKCQEDTSLLILLNWIQFYLSQEAPMDVREALQRFPPFYCGSVILERLATPRFHLLDPALVNSPLRFRQAAHELDAPPKKDNRHFKKTDVNK